MDSNPNLKISHKLDILRAVFNREPIHTILKGLTSSQLIEAHQFLWDKLVEIHYLTQEKEFIREDITKKMVPSATYQQQQGCDLRLDYCKGVECIYSNPICACKKVKNNMEVMARTINNYVDSSATNNKTGKKEKKRKEVKVWL